MILITGATGHVGRELVPQLLASTQSVRVFVRDPRKVAHLPEQVERAIGDLDQPHTLDAALQDVDRLYLMTFATPQDKAVLQAAKQAGVKHIVKLFNLRSRRP